MSERTEQPTPLRLRKAREDGQHPRSRILSAVLPIVCGAWALAATPELLRVDTAAWVREALGGLAAPQWVLHEGLRLALRVAGPVAAAAGLGALGAGVLQAGLSFDLARASVKLQRFDVAGALRRIATGRALADLARPSAVAAVLLALGASAVAELLPQGPRFLRAAGSEVALTTAALGQTAARLRPLLIALAALAALDLLFARWLHARSLRMTRDEVKQEHRRQEGDPHHKSKRRAFHRTLSQQGPARGVARAQVVVVNPTQLAIALRYAPHECESPYVVARGREDDAASIRREARAQGVPIVRDVPLARSLIRLELGDEIPEELFRAAAAVLKVALAAAPPATDCEGSHG